MGAISSFHWLEDSVLDEIYGWETYLACPSEEVPYVRFNADKELRLKINSSSLDHWLDLSA
jgi:hypothetical protein